MATFQNLIDDARKTIVDVGKTRWPDSDMLIGMNHAMQEFRRLRPDLFIGGTWNAPLPTYILGDTFPLSPEFEHMAEEYAIAWAQSRDDDYSDNPKAMMFLKKFKQEVIGA